MIHETRKYQVNILDESFSILSDDSEKLVMDTISHVDTLMKEISQKSTVLDAKKVAILVALKLGSKMLKLESEIEEMKKAEKNLLNLIENEVSSSY